MTFDLNKPNSSTFYLNLSKTGSGDVNDFCEQTQNYNQALIKNSKNWVLSVERATIPLQGIKFINDIPSAVNFVNKATGAITVNSLENIFNLHDFLQALNNMADSNSNKIQVFLKTSGRLELKYSHFNNFNIVLDEILQKIFDFPNQTLTSANNVTSILGASSCLDRIDRIKRVILVSRDLPLVSEYSNRSKTREITSIDYSPSITFSSTAGNNKVIDDDYSINLYGRDDLVLEPHYSRLLNMQGAQIITITVEAQVEVLNHSTGELELERITLRPFSTFNVKLQFRRRNV